MSYARQYRIACVIVAMGLSLAGFASAAVIYVDDSATGGNNDGSSWFNAYTSLQSALSAALPNDQIWVAAGIYKPMIEVGGTGDRYKTFQLKNGMSLLGGYAGLGAADPNARDIEAYETILSGDLMGDDNGNIAPEEPTRQDNCYHVFYHPSGTNLDSSAVIDGFTITGANANGIDYFVNDSGGGMYNNSSSPTVTHCTFSGNSANGYDGGGGMFNFHSSPAVTNCTFTANSTTLDGGGMSNSSSSPVVTNCTFTANSSTWDGGGMYSYLGAPVVTNCSFSGNSAYSGGGMFSTDSYPIISNCIFKGNSAANYGGGMYNDESDPTLTNCIFSGNSATSGGGMTNYRGSNPAVANCTFAANSATSGGGMYNYVSFPNVANSILWGNMAIDSPQICNDSGIPNIRYSDVQGGWTGTGNICADPRFVRNPGPGPDGAWGTSDDDYGDLRLCLGSPCIDAGDNAAVPGSVTADLNGQPRFIDDPEMVDKGSGTPPIVDIGPYEGPAPVVSVPNFDPPGGCYHKVQEVIITCVTPLSRIHYTTNGRDPNESDPVVESGESVLISVDPPTTLKARAYRSDVNPSAVKTAVYRLAVFIFVRPNGNDNNNGLRWASAKQTIQAGMDVTSADEVWVAAGTYKPTIAVGGTGDRYKTFQLKNGVALYGSLAGTEDPNTFNLADRDFNAHETILSGDLMGDDNGNIAPEEPTRQDNCYHVFYHPSGTNLDSSAVIDGFTITGANANGIDYFVNDSGGGMYNNSGSPTVTHCTFSGNSANGYAGGGGMFNFYSSPAVTNCTFTANSATWDGAGMYNYRSSPTPTNCTFNGNSALDCGGAMWNSSNSPTLTNCTFIGNSAGDAGGGLYNIDGSSPTVTNCILWCNTAPYRPQICNYYNATATVTYCDVQDGWTGTGNVDADPNFVRDPNSGSDGTWGTADDDYGDLRLQPGSPCIDAGNNAALPPDSLDLDGDGNTTEPIPFDLADNPRVVDGNCDSQVTVDMGAYEFALTGDLSADCYVNLPDVARLSARWLEDDCHAAGQWCGGADLNHDGQVSLNDLAEFAAYWLMDSSSH